MSWLPVLKLGLWNAWMLMLIFLLHPYLLRMVDKAVGTGDIFKKMGEAPSDKGQRRLNTIFMVIQMIMLVYSIFLPLRLGTMWFYIGMAIYLAGLAVLLASMVNITTTPPGQLFTGGMYRWSRHPAYLAMSLLYIGVGIACADWIFLFLAVTLVILFSLQAVIEERGCLAQFGDAYREYMQRTPRWLGMPKSR